MTAALVESGRELAHVPIGQNFAWSREVRCHAVRHQMIENDWLSATRLGLAPESYPTLAYKYLLAPGPF